MAFTAKSARQMKASLKADARRFKGRTFQFPTGKSALRDGSLMSMPLPILAAGFFETNYILTELIVLPIFALLLAGAMASNTTTERIETKHYDFWNQPQGRSYTDVPVPKEPSSPSEINNTLIVLAVIYLVLRLTCLSGLFTIFFKMIGSFIDTFFK